jgi:hypothetical protein
MGLVASVIVSALPLLGGIQLDADSHGRGVLAWHALRGNDFVVQTVDVADGRPRGRVRELWRTPGNVAVGQLDVAPSGAALVCFSERQRRSEDAWRIRIARRLPGQAWSKPTVIAEPRGYLADLACGVGDAGETVVAWRAGSEGSSTAVFVGADGVIDAPFRLAPGVDPPQVAVAPDGNAVVAFTDEPRTLRAAVRPAGGVWAVRAVTTTPAFLPQLAEDGTLGWSDDGSVRLESGTLTTVPDTTLTTLSSSVRGDTLATWITHASGYPRGATRLRAVVRRPGREFSPPVTLGRVTAYPLTTVLAPDGTGAAAWVTGGERSPRLVARLLGADGHWGAQRVLPGYAAKADLAAASGGRVTIAWLTRGAEHDTLRLALIADPRGD